MRIEKVKEKFPPLSKLKKDLDTVFSIYIRQRDEGRCFTCPAVKPWKQQQAGHYVSRQHLATRWDEMNVHCQCVGCNVFKHGNMDVYALKLQEKYGSQVLGDLNAMKQQTTKLQPWEMIRLINFYRDYVFR